MNTKAESTTQYKFLEAYLIFNRIRANPACQIAHNITLVKGGLAIYNLTIFELKSFAYSSGTKFLSTDNAVMGQ
jgi:hypothetical protein